MKYAIAALALVLLAAMPAAAKTKAKKPAEPPAPKQITFEAPSLYPEGIAFNPHTQEFIVGSLHDGRIGAVSMDGKYRKLIDNPRIASSFGLHIDAPRNRLLVCVADLGTGTRTQKNTQKKLAAVASFDMTTGTLLGWHDLGILPPGNHFANDLAVDEDGNIFVTDSFAALIYKIDPIGRASIAFADPAFMPVKDGPGVGLNGIVAHPGGYLLTVKMDSGELFRIDTDTYDIVRVALSEPLLYGDGLLLDKKNDLIVVENDNGRVVKLHSADDWHSAKVVASREEKLQFPTTATEANGKNYVLEAKLPELFDIKAPKSNTFTIHDIGF